MAPLQIQGMWGKPTSTIDWCENNYEVSYYIAEFWNTVSNLSMIVPPAWGAYNAWKDALGLRFVICHMLLLIVGVGSWSFHMTLLYEMQLFDELPMVWGSCVLIYCLVGMLFPEISQRRIVAVGLFSYAFLVTVVYLTIKKPVFHEVAYGLLVAFIFLMDIHLARTRKCDLRLFIVGAVMYFFGFFLWNIDNVYCGSLRSARLELPGSIGPVTQLHAWWHVLAGYATYMHIVFCAHAAVVTRKLDYTVTRNAFFGLSLVKKESEPLSNGTVGHHSLSNGTVGHYSLSNGTEHHWPLMNGMERHLSLKNGTEQRHLHQL